MGNLNSVEIEDRVLNPEQRLWKAVFRQGLDDALGRYTIPMNRRERQAARFWVNSHNEDFKLVCEHAGIDHQHAAKKIKTYQLLQRIKKI
jgi:hypothetical protein